MSCCNVWWGAIGIGTATCVKASGEDVVAVVQGGLDVEGRTTGVAWRVHGSLVTLFYY